MDSIPLVVWVILISVLCFVVFDRAYTRPKRRREAEAAPRITMDEVQAAKSLIRDAALPMAKAIVDPSVTMSPDGSRIGGAPLCLDDQASWPLSEFDGSPLPFVCQINFSELPPLADFPTEGILQLFSSFDSTDETFVEHERVIRWASLPTEKTVLPIPDALRDAPAKNDDFSPNARQNGLALRFERSEALGNPHNRPIADQIDTLFDNRLPEDDAVKAALDSFEEEIEAIPESYGVHWVGGQPYFIQEDIRTSEKFAHLDRVIFHLGCDDDICLGDSGVANLMISREALLKRDFQKAVFTWDCS